MPQSPSSKHKSPFMVGVAVTFIIYLIYGVIAFGVGYHYLDDNTKPYAKKLMYSGLPAVLIIAVLIFGVLCNYGGCDFILAMMSLK
jgi:hypothetical protein